MNLLLDQMHQKQMIPIVKKLDELESDNSNSEFDESEPDCSNSDLDESEPVRD